MSARTQAIYLSRFGLVFYPQTIAFHLIFLFSERRKRDKNHTNCGLREVLSILLAWVSLQTEAFVVYARIVEQLSFPNITAISEQRKEAINSQHLGFAHSDTF